jgi:hypothetical protein
MERRCPPRVPIRIHAAPSSLSSNTRKVWPLEPGLGNWRPYAPPVAGVKAAGLAKDGLVAW